jgi:hypothetical protein
MKRLLFIVFVVGGINAMDRVQLRNPIFASPEVSALATQIQECRDHCSNPACNALRKYLHEYAQNVDCDNSCPAASVDKEMCELMEHARNGQLAEHLQKVHNMSYNPATQCERFLDRIANQ